MNQWAFILPRLSLFSFDRYTEFSGALKKTLTSGQCFAEEAIDMGVSQPHTSRFLPDATALGPSIWEQL